MLSGHAWNPGGEISWMLSSIENGNGMFLFRAVASLVMILRGVTRPITSVNFDSTGYSCIHLAHVVCDSNWACVGPSLLFFVTVSC